MHTHSFVIKLIEMNGTLRYDPQRQFTILCMTNRPTLHQYYDMVHVGVDENVHCWIESMLEEKIISGNEEAVRMECKKVYTLESD